MGNNKGKRLKEEENKKSKKTTNKKESKKNDKKTVDKKESKKNDQKTVDKKDTKKNNEKSVNKKGNKNSKNNDKTVKKKQEKTSNKNTKKQKKAKFLPKILAVLFIAVIIAGVIFGYKAYQNGGGLQGFLAAAMGHNKDTKKNLQEFRVLLLGVSTDIDVKLTDTIIVASYNPNTQKATLLSVPRDTFVGTSEKRASGYDKINAQYNITKGPEGTLEAVNEITGLDIEYYAVVETESLIKLVDAIGGVNFNVPINMKYDDPTQNLHINLKAGEQEIDGEKAEQLLRFRHNNDGSSYPSEYGDNDFGRMRTQREFISETLRQTLKVENIFKIGQILDIAKESIETNINFSAIKDYIPYLVEFKTENLVSDTVPGTPTELNQLWFFKYDKKATEELVHKLFYERDYGKSEDDEETNTISNTTTTNSTKNSKTKNTTKTSSSTSAEGKSKEKLTVNVVDGTNGSDRYEQAIQALESAGFNVTKPKKAGVPSSRTVIVNQKYADSSILEEIKTVLEKGDISNNGSSSSESDISITIGSDY